MSDIRRAAFVVAAASAVLGAAGFLSGCSLASAPETVTEADTSASRPTAPAQPAATPAASETVLPDLSDAETAPDPAAAGTSSTMAVDAVTAFCRPSLDYQTWINGLYPFLSQSAAVAYETVDPANVPCTLVTGPAVIRDGDDVYTTRVLVPTDAGDYSVYVHRPLETSPWAVEEITPMDSE